VANSSYVHIRAGSDFAPADAKLYAIRRQHDAVKSTELAVASLLAKKLCISCKALALDVRVGRNGNVANDEEEALTFSRRFIHVAQLLGIRARCVITDLRKGLPSRYIGRGESLRGLALAVNGTIGERELCALDRLAEEALTVAGEIDAVTKLKATRNQDSIARVAGLLEPHGVLPGALSRRLKELEQFFEIPILCTRSGWIDGFELKALKNLILKLYSVLDPYPVTPIWEVGMVCMRSSGRISVGERLLLLRVKEEFSQKLVPLVDRIRQEANFCVVWGEASKDLGSIIGVVGEDGQLSRVAN